MDVDPIESTTSTTFFVMIFSFVGAVITKESFDLNAYKQAIIPLLYVSLICSALGISLQTHAQKTLDETTASLILSLESLFSVFAGYLLLDVALSKKELIGCLLMFAAVVMCITSDRNATDKQ